MTVIQYLKTCDHIFQDTSNIQGLPIAYILGYFLPPALISFSFNYISSGVLQKNYFLENEEKMKIGVRWWYYNYVKGKGFIFFGVAPASLVPSQYMEVKEMTAAAETMTLIRSFIYAYLLPWSIFQNLVLWWVGYG